MSFVKMLATLAVGFAAAKGMDKFKQGGGLAGMQEKMKAAGGQAGANPLGDMFAKLGLPGGGDLSKMMGGGGTGASGGLGAILGALGGMGAAGVANAAGMMDQLTGTKAATEASEANAKLMIRAMIQAAKADGRIDDQERATLMEHLKDATPEELAFVKAEMDAPVDPLALAQDTAETAKLQVYTAAAMAVRIDTPAEAQFLATLARGLGLDPATVANLHDTVGKPAPKA